jgi:hypothetical protein
MTQLGEMVAIGVVSAADIDCPFHEDEHDCSKPGKNELEGDATALGKSVVSGASTVVRTDDPDIRHKAPEVEADPDHATEESREVSILADTADKDKKENCIYPVAFSAHHLIPAAESLKRAPGLHKFMQKSKGKICCDLGYDVNGNENGVWLPGLHAVNSKGLNLWGSAPTSLPDKEEVGRRVVKRAGYKYSPLRGPRPGTGGALAFGPTNMKWMYVQKAMTFLGPRQFHDRHANYSRLVKEQLMAVGKRLETFYGLRKDPEIAGCPKCRSRKKKEKAPPPVQLLGLLNKTSKTFLRGKVKGRTQDDEYYTSSWCRPLAQTASAVKIAAPKKPKGK